MSKTGNIMPKGKKRRIPALFQLLLVVGFLALTWFSFGQNVLAPQKQAAVPERLGILELVSSNSGFSNLKLLTVTQGYHIHEVFQVEGPGGKHFFYHSRESRERIVWLSIESGDTMSILEQAVKTF